MSRRLCIVVALSALLSASNPSGFQVLAEVAPSAEQQQAALLEIIDIQGQDILPGTIVNTTLGPSADQSAMTVTYTTIVSSRNFEKVDRVTDDSRGREVIVVELKSAAADILYQFTEANIGNSSAFVLGKRVLSTFWISDAIADTFVIGSGLSPDETDKLFEALRNGYMAEPFQAGTPMITDGYARVLVDSRTGWQNTGLIVESGTNIQEDLFVGAIGGSWSEATDPNTKIEASGLGYVCANHLPANECVEPMLESPRGAVIGRVAEQLINLDINYFPSIKVQETGVLYLRVNQEDASLDDNNGLIMLEIRGEITSV